MLDVHVCPCSDAFHRTHGYIYIYIRACCFSDLEGFSVRSWVKKWNEWSEWNGFSLGEQSLQEPEGFGRSWLHSSTVRTMTMWLLMIKPMTMMTIIIIILLIRMTMCPLGMF